MIESGRVVGIEDDALWIETQQHSTCGSCSMRAGCGQSLLQQMYPTRSKHIRVLRDDRFLAEKMDYAVDDWVEFSVPDHMVVRGSVLLYLSPIAGLLSGALLTAQLFSHELAVIAGAAVGFTLAVLVVRWRSRLISDAEEFQPQVSGRIGRSGRALRNDPLPTIS